MSVGARTFAVVRPYLSPTVLLVGVWIFMTSWVPGFGGQSGVYAVMENVPLLGLIALGIGVTVIAGELDLSVTSMAAIAAVLTVKTSGAGLVPAIVIPVAAAGAFGAVQGAAIALLRINSLMLTLGTLIMLRGLTYVASGSAIIAMKDFSISDSLLHRYGFLSPSSIIALGAFAFIGAFMAFLRPGRYIYAIGGGRTEARAAGVSSVRTLTICFAFSATCAALAGALAAVRGGSASPQNFDSLLLPAVAAVLIGGIGLAGGRGTVVNVLLGTCVLGVISAGLAARGSDPSVAQLVQGLMLLAVLSIEFATLRLSGRRRPGRAPRPSSASLSPDASERGGVR